VNKEFAHREQKETGFNSNVSYLDQTETVKEIPRLDHLDQEKIANGYI